MDYNPSTWVATGDGWSITWNPTEPHLTGSEVAVEMTRERLLQGNLLTPTGPLVEGDESDPLAVRAALPAQAELSGNPPPIPSVPDDAVS